MADSETLRAALRAADTAIIDATKKTDPRSPGDKQPSEDLVAAGLLVRKCRLTLEAGEWSGRSVNPYPVTGKRI